MHWARFEVNDVTENPQSWTKGNFKYRNITSHREHIYTQLQQSFYQAIELEELQAVKKQVTGKERN